MTLPILAKKVKKLASFQIFNIKLLLNVHMDHNEKEKDGSPKSPHWGLAHLLEELAASSSSRGFSKFKKTYKLKGEIGRGGFGIVYRAVRIADETPVAVKFIDRRNVRDWGKLNDERVPMEICMLARCTKIRGVIRLLDWYSIPEGFLIVMERPYPCIDLFDFIKGQTKLDEDMARFLFSQVVQTIGDCAEKRVLHRDLKDENIIIDLVNGETKLIDFGAATVLKKSHYTDFQAARCVCRACRLQKCIEAGMKTLGLKDLASIFDILAVEARDAEKARKEQKDNLLSRLESAYAKLQSRRRLQHRKDVLRLPTGDCIDLNEKRTYAEVNGEWNMKSEDLMKYSLALFPRMQQGLLKPFEAMQPSGTELCALIALQFWSRGIERVSEETEQLVARVQERLLNELHEHMRLNGVKDPARRLSELLIVVAQLHRMLPRLQALMTMQRLSGLYKMDDNLYRIFTGSV